MQLLLEEVGARDIGVARSRPSTATGRADLPRPRLRRDARIVPWEVKFVPRDLGCVAGCQPDRFESQ